MASAMNELLSDPKRSQNLALGLGVLGGPLVAIAIALESTILLIIGCIVLVGSGAVWAIRGIREDQAKG